ncbi:hypothetical protein NQ315_009600 [Exocentrus adspersus]|uniref:Uncharacterized protein n=1 Tax=Exocentrus adspersus TaxID=1586481 RepID=A0AAV8WHG1_9CUCU|nr:hypothetical protein NQ315_009600 [Exocentrus adspersus]
MLETNRSKRSKPRKESGIHGKHYERKTLAVIALKCLLHEDINDFWILSNPEDVEKFDDIILSTEHANGQKKVFFIQVKHKLPGKERPLVAHKLDREDKDLGLKVYEKAFLETDFKDFFERHDIQHKSKIILVLFTNHNVDQKIPNDNIGFECGSNSQFSFINTTLTPDTILKIKNKTGKYNQHFIDKFYFYTEQLSEDSINKEICRLLEFNDATTQILVSFVSSWVDPNKDYCIKLKK